MASSGMGESRRIQLPAGPARGNAAALRRASHPVVGASIEALECRQLLSIANPLFSAFPALISPEMHAQTVQSAPASVVTNKLDYTPGQVAAITGKGFGANEQVRVQVLHIDGTPNTAPEHKPWVVRADKNGSFHTSYTIGKDDLNTTLQLTAVGLTTHRTAKETFKDAATATTTTVASSATTTVFGQPVTFTATVTTGATGTVTFLNGTTTLGTATLSSAKATFVTATLSVSAHSITAKYGGDTAHAASTSAAITQTVQRAATTVALTSSTSAGQAPIVRPSHIVVVVEEDRGANAIGDTADMPYFNQLAASGLVYSNSHGLNTTSQEGQMTYLGLYSGSTQGVTDNSNNGIFTGPNLAQSLANNGLSFSGYAESLPYNGDTTDNYAADPTNPAYDDLYVRAYNPMAQFSNVGTGLTNANVNQTFASFPTTASGYASLPTVSFVIPDTLHNTHGSNDTDPYATDPSAYNLLRQNADTWLQQNLGGYLQWAKQNNSLLIVTDDEGDRAHNFAGGFATIVNGSSALFTPGVDTSNVNAYNILRTVEDMYGLPQLGASATTSDLDINAQGKLGLSGAGGSSVVGQGVTFTATVAPVSPGAGTPTGTVQFVLDGANLGNPVSLANGSATSSSVSFPTTGSHTVSAVYGSDGNFATSSAPTLTQSVIQASTTTALNSSAVASVFSQSVTFTATVSAAAPGAGTPTGAVTFLDGTTTLGIGNVNGSGQATFTTSALAVASHSITAVFGSDSNYTGSTSPAISQSVTEDATTTSTTSSANPVMAGQPVTFTALIAAATPGLGTPTGTVTFFDGANTLGTGTLDSSGKATFTSANLSTDLHAITASYAGDGNFVASGSSVLNQVVSMASVTTPSTTVIASSANPSVFGQPVTFTATVAPGDSSSGTPTGAIQFMIDGINIGSPVPLVNGSASTGPLAALTAAGHSIAAVYSGDTIFSPGSATSFSQIVGKSLTSTSLAPSIPASVFGQSVTLTATIIIADAGAGIPTGSVTFADGITTLGTIALNSSGQAAFTTSALAVTSHSFTATYSGDADFAGSASMPQTQSVSQASTTAALISSANPSVAGSSVTFTATVAAAAPGAGIPTGTVTFLDGTTTLGSSALDGSGKATFTTSTLAVASHSITASYGGDANFTGSTSAAVMQQVAPTPPTNDNFASATTITGSSATVTGTNAAATKQTGEPAHAGNAGGESVWWSWKAPSGGVVTIDTSGSNFDTLLAVYTGSSVSALTAVPNGSNDNDPAGGVVTSKVTFAVTSGTTYKIAVDGFNGASGNITVHLALVVIPAAPTGVTATKASYTNKVHVTWAASTGATAYEIWRGTTSSSASATKISAADVTGTTAYDDTSALAGTTYYYWVKAKNIAGTSGFSASAQGYLEPLNDNFANATLISGKSATVTGTNLGATKQTGEPKHAGNAGGKSVWWVWTPTTSGTVTIDTHGSSFNTLLAVYTGSSVSALTAVPGGSNDNDPAGGTTTSKVSFKVIAGTTYHIAVDGYGGASGNITLHLSLA